MAILAGNLLVAGTFLGANGRILAGEHFHKALLDLAPDGTERDEQGRPLRGLNNMTADATGNPYWTEVDVANLERSKFNAVEDKPGVSRVACLGTILVLALSPSAFAQSADWQSVVWREPQVRYLLADMTLGGNTKLYRDYATTERDPDSREAIRLWDLGARVANTNDFERRWLTNKFGKEGRVMRIVHRGTERTILGTEVLLTSDYSFQQGPMRLVLLDLTLGASPDSYRSKQDNGSVAEALRRWTDGCRVVNTNRFEARATSADQTSHLTVRLLVYRGTETEIDATHIRLNSDVPWPETNVRYFMADIALGGNLEFYRAAAERDHEMGCLEAVRRTEEGYKITNLDQFERKKVDGKTLITRKGSNERISGMRVQLSSD